MADAGDRPRTGIVRDLLLLPERFTHRIADYLQDAGDLLRSGSLEPAEWIGSYTKFWAAVLGDVGDWMERQASQPLRPTAEWAARSQRQIAQSQRTATIPIDVPLEAFGERDTVTLVTDGLSRGDRHVVIDPERNLRFSPPTVSPEHRRSELKLFDLQLEPGLYSGIVCARESDLTVAVIELMVFSS